MKLTWVLTSNFSEGVPYAIVNIMMVAMFADLGLDAGTVTLLTSLLSLPWAIKALWSPVVDTVGTKRSWMLWMQAVMAVVLGLAAMSLGLQTWLVPLVVCAALIAFASATYDISCDGYYMLALDEKDQSFLVGFRSFAYRLGMLLVTGGLTALAGWWMSRDAALPAPAFSAWAKTLAVAAALFAGLCLLHNLLLPKVEQRSVCSGSVAASTPSSHSLGTAMADTVRTFFLKPGLPFMFLFLFTYRLGEAFLSKTSILFLKTPVEEGGIGLGNTDYGLLYGTVGILALVVGGILGGIAISSHGKSRMEGIRRWIIPMAIALNVPDLLYVWMSYAQPQSLWVVGSCIAIEQFGYGFGFTAYTVYLLECAQGPWKTAHYAFLTALMAVGMMIPSAVSGYCMNALSFPRFFILTCLLTVPGFLVSFWMVRRRVDHDS